MLMFNSGVNPPIYSPYPIVEKYSTNTIGAVNCGGTNLNPNDCYVYYLVNNKTTKEEVLELFKDEIYFDIDDEVSAEREIKMLKVEKQGNFYNYYD